MWTKLVSPQPWPVSKNETKMGFNAQYWHLTSLSTWGSNSIRGIGNRLSSTVCEAISPYDPFWSCYRAVRNVTWLSSAVKHKLSVMQGETLKLKWTWTYHRCLLKTWVLKFILDLTKQLTNRYLLEAHRCPGAFDHFLSMSIASH